MALAMAESETPNLYQLMEIIDKCLIGEDDVNLEQYCSLWTHLCRIMNNWGTIFAFVVKDVTGKVEKLEEKLAANPKEYKTILSMGNYEQANGTIRRRKPNRSGCGDVIVLNRALAFVIGLLNDVFTEQKGDAKVSSIAQAVYEQTLSKYHSWMIRKVVWAALLTLPYRDDFVKKLRGEMPASDDEKFHVHFDRHGRQILERVDGIVGKFQLADFEP